MSIHFIPLTFKTTLKRDIEVFTVGNTERGCVSSLTKQNAIEIASSSWSTSAVNKSDNIISGFKTSGLWPLL
jgi:hypothetical protein